MLCSPNLQQFYTLLFFALIPKTTRPSFAFALAFSSSSCPFSMSTDTPDNNTIALSFLETLAKNSGDETKLESSLPPTLLVHGLDSSSQTWVSLLDDLGSTGFGAVAVDQRGCGRSSLGDTDRFSPDALVEDLFALVASHPLFSTKNGTTKPFVLVGHSMGGRTATSFAAKHPELIAALVIEDMDIKKRMLSTSRIRSNDRDATLAFDRELTGISSPQEILEVFVNEGYPPSQVEKWLTEGRVERKKDDGAYYSQVNPAFRLLCYEQFFETNHGEDTWKKLAAIEKEKRFPIHLMIADPTMTICDDDSVLVMEEVIDESSSPSLLTIHRYKEATHSIHNSVPVEFATDLKAIIERAQNQNS